MTIMLGMNEAAILKQRIHRDCDLADRLVQVQERLSLEMGNYFVTLSDADVTAIEAGAKNWHDTHLQQRCKILKAAIDRSTGY